MKQQNLKFFAILLPAFFTGQLVLVPAFASESVSDKFRSNEFRIVDREGLRSDPEKHDGFKLRRSGCSTRPEERPALLELATRKFEITDASERHTRVLELADCLGDPDPRLRDDVAFSGLSSWLRAGLINDDMLLRLAERLMPWVEAKEDTAGFRRSFAALTLSEIARADRLKPSLPDAVRGRIVAAAATNIETIRDYRGFDPKDGWRHAVAHGADLVLQIGLHPATTAAEGQLLFDALAKQIAPNGAVYTQGESERLARAAFFVYGRGLLTDEYWDGWFKTLGTPAPAKAPPSVLQVLARVHNTKAFLHAVAFASRVNPGPANDRLAKLADRELRRFHTN